MFSYSQKVQDITVSDIIDSGQLLTLKDYPNFKLKSYILFNDYLLHNHNILLSFCVFWCYVSRATYTMHFAVFCTIHQYDTLIFY